MHIGKPILVRGKPLGGGGVPAVCTPLVGRTGEQILSEVAQVKVKQPDLLEWRVDFFADIGDLAKVLALAADIRLASGGIPLLFTRRSVREGGESIAVSEDYVVAMVCAVCEAGMAELVDFEMASEPAHIARVHAAAQAHGVVLVLSHHNFHLTPPPDVLRQRFAQAQQLGADVAKIAVMPQRLEDVLILLSATLESSQSLEIPLISMSMGSQGVLTRLFGGVFGSAMSFAVGASSSAPGQVPIEDMSAALRILAKSMGER
jgi:3-dehydroquinate dehydratase-1